MKQKTLYRFLVVAAFMPLVLAFVWSDWSGRAYARIETVVFSRDGSRIAVAKLTGRNAHVQFKNYVKSIVRTISSVDVLDGVQSGDIHRDVSPEISATGSSFWSTQRNSIQADPQTDQGFYRLVGSDVFLDDRKLDIEYPVFSLVLSDSGQFLAAVGEPFASIIATSTNEVINHVLIADTLVAQWSVFAFDHLDTNLVAREWDELIGWNIVNGAKTSISLGEDGAGTGSIAAGPDMSWILCTHRGVCRYDDDGKRISRLTDDDADLCCTSADRSLLALVDDAAGFDKHLTLYDLAENSVLHQVAMPQRITCLAFSPDNTSIVVGDSDGFLTLLDVESGKMIWKSSFIPFRMSWPWQVPAAFFPAWAYAAFCVFRAGKDDDTGAQDKEPRIQSMNDLS